MTLILIVAAVMLVLVAVGQPHRIDRGDLTRLDESRRRDYRELARRRHQERQERRQLFARSRGL
jgi:hypothetical protein